MYLSKLYNVFVLKCKKYFSKLHNIFDESLPGGKCRDSSVCQMYLSKLSNVFFQTVKCTCPNCKRYLCLIVKSISQNCTKYLTKVCQVAKVKTQRCRHHLFFTLSLSLWGAIMQARIVVTERKSHKCAGSDPLSKEKATNVQTYFSTQLA